MELILQAHRLKDLDDDGDNVPDTDEDTAGTDSLLPDTDGDGVCDGDIAVGSVCVAGPDAFPLALRLRLTPMMTVIR